MRDLEDGQRYPWEVKNPLNSISCDAFILSNGEHAGFLPKLTSANTGSLLGSFSVFLVLFWTNKGIMY